MLRKSTKLTAWWLALTFIIGSFFLLCIGIVFSQDENLEKVYIGILSYETTQDEDSNEEKEILRPLAILYLENNTYKEALNTVWDDNDMGHRYSHFPEVPLKFFAFYRGERIGSFVAQKKEEVFYACDTNGDGYTGESSVDKKYLYVKYGDNDIISRKVLTYFPDAGNFKPIQNASYPVEKQNQLKDVLIETFKRGLKNDAKKIKNYKLEQFNMFFLEEGQEYPYLAGTIKGVVSGKANLEFPYVRFGFVVAKYDSDLGGYVPLIMNISKPGEDELSADEETEMFLDFADFNGDGTAEIVTFVSGYSFRIYTLQGDKYKMVFEGERGGC